jgi:PPP family 3-phenylpropionic acid transporter
MKDSPAFPHQLLVLRALNFASYATMVLIISYIPLYFYSLGFTKLQIGTIYSVGPVLSIISNVLAGVLSDRTGSLRRILSLLYAGQILALALLLPQREFGIMAAVMALFYLFQTPVNSMLDSLSLLGAAKLDRSFPSIRMFGSLGYAVCALLFGLLLKTYGSDLTIALILATVTISLVLSLLVTNFQAAVGKFEFSGLWQVLRKRETVAFFALLMLVSVAHRLNEGFIAVAMRDAGAGDEVIGVALLVSSASEIPTLFLLARYGHRFKEFPLLAIASLLYIVRMLLLSVVHDPWGFVGIQAMHSVTFGIFYVTALRCLQSMIPDKYRSSGQAVFSVVWAGAAGLLAGTLGGWLYDAQGVSSLFRMGAGFAVAGCLGFLVLHFRRTTP